MGIPLPAFGALEAPAHGHEAGTADVQAARTALDEAAVAATASLRSLSSLLLAARSVNLPSAAAPSSSLAALDRLSRLSLSGPEPTRLPPAPVRPQPRVPSSPPREGSWQAIAWSPPPLSPPPLAPGSDSESEADYDDLPSLLSDSPHSQQGLLEEFCPWYLGDRPPREATNHSSGAYQNRPVGGLQQHISAFRSNALVMRSNGLGLSMPASTSSGDQPASSTAALALDAELVGLAGKVAQLMQVHHQQLSAADPQMRASLQDVANQLHSLASTLQAGPPPPA